MKWNAMQASVLGLLDVALGVLLLALGSPVEAQTGFYHGWALSASASDPYLQEIPFVSGVQEFALWLICTDASVNGSSGAELWLEMSEPSNVITAFTPAPGWVNVGSLDHLRLSAPNCVTGEVYAGTVSVDLSVPGQLCMIGQSEDCDSEFAFSIEWMGIEFGEGVPCASICRACLDKGGLCQANQFCDTNIVYCDEKGNCIHTSIYCECREANGYCGRCEDCVTAVTPNTWGRVKATYR